MGTFGRWSAPPHLSLIFMRGRTSLVARLGACMSSRVPRPTEQQFGFSPISMRLSMCFCWSAGARTRHLSYIQQPSINRLMPVIRRQIPFINRLIPLIHCIYSMKTFMLLMQTINATKKHIHAVSQRLPQVLPYSCSMQLIKREMYHLQQNKLCVMNSAQMSMNT